MLPSRTQLAALVVMFACVPAVAQDLTVTPFRWHYGQDNPQTLPRRDAPDLSGPLPDRIEHLTRPSYARVREAVDEDGLPLARTVTSELPWLESPARELFMSTRQRKPATRDGKPVVADIEYFLVYNPASAAPNHADATPRLLEPSLVILPSEAGDAERVFVEFEFTIDSTGRPVALRPLTPKLGRGLTRAAEATLKDWKFSPARSKGTPVASTVVAPVLFVREPPSRDADTPPQPILRIRPTYPRQARLSGLPGRVEISCVIDVEGRPRELVVLESTHAQFERAALQAIADWRYRPAKKDGHPVASRFVQVVDFKLEGEDSASPLRVVGDPARIKKLPPELQWDTPPEYTEVYSAVYPFEALADGKEGSAQLLFVIGKNGRVLESQSVAASDPVFAGAALAMIESFRFVPASKAGKPSLALLSLKVEFAKSGSLLVHNDRETTLVMRRLAKDRASFALPENLDEPLVLRRAGVRRFPLNARGDSGEAKVEYVVDRDGVVRCPHVLSASAPEFGFAAAQLVSTRRYAPPQRDGESLEVLVFDTVKFDRAAATR